MRRGRRTSPKIRGGRGRGPRNAIQQGWSGTEPRPPRKTINYQTFRQVNCRYTPWHPDCIGTGPTNPYSSVNCRYTPWHPDCTGTGPTNPY